MRWGNIIAGATGLALLWYVYSFHLDWILAAGSWIGNWALGPLLD